MPYVTCVVLRSLRNDIIVLLGLLATVRLIRQVCVVLRVLCVKGAAMQLLFYLFSISHNPNININVNSCNFIGGMAKALRL